MVFATIAMGMGVDIPAIKNIIHIGPPRTVREYMQETGRAGRDGSSPRVSLFYNNRDIGKNKKGISEDIRAYCHLEQSCMRKHLLGCLDAELTNKLLDTHVAAIAVWYVTVLIVQNGLQHKIGYYKPLGPNFIIICCLFSNFFFAYTVCLTFLKVILIKSIYKNKLENILLTKVSLRSRRYSRAHGGNLKYCLPKN